MPCDKFLLILQSVQLYHTEMPGGGWHCGMSADRRRGMACMSATSYADEAIARAVPMRLLRLIREALPPLSTDASKSGLRGHSRRDDGRPPSSWSSYNIIPHVSGHINQYHRRQHAGKQPLIRCDASLASATSTQGGPRLGINRLRSGKSSNLPSLLGSNVQDSAPLQAPINTKIGRGRCAAWSVR